MVERPITPEVLLVRSDTIIKGIQRAIDHGLDPSEIREIESNERSKLHHRDFLGVLLGLKPLFAEFGPQGTPSVYGTYIFSTFHQEKNTGVETLWHNGFVWNPKMIGSVFEEHKKLIPANVYINPYDKEWFSSLVSSLHQAPSNIAEQACEVLGLLYGYPKKATRLYSKYGLQVTDAMGEVWHKADSRGYKLPWNPPISTMQLAENTNGVRDDLARLIKLPGLTPEELEIDRNVISYALLIRNSDTPYFPFATTLNPETGRHITGLSTNAFNLAKV